MIVKSMVVGMIAANCYILGCPESKEGIVIDPGASAGKIKEEIDKQKLKITAIVNTHGHYDHIGANSGLKEATGAPIILCEKDLGIYKKPGAALSIILKNQPLPDKYISHGDNISFGSYTLKVLETPGHTPGGISLAWEGSSPAVFTGDTLFNYSIGRTDLAGGSYEEIIKSIKEQIMVFPDETVVYPGHGPASTVGHERNLNPFLK